MQENEKRPNAEVDDNIIDRGARSMPLERLERCQRVRPVGVCWQLQGTPGLLGSPCVKE